VAALVLDDRKAHMMGQYKGVVALHHSDIDLELLQLLNSDTLQQRAAYAAAQLVYNTSPKHTTQLQASDPLMAL
jgi:hypothetical protein